MKINKWPVCFSNLQWLLLSLVIVILDMFTKFLVISNCILGKLIIFLPCVNLYYVYNFGVAFSLFSEFGIKQSSILLLIVTFLVLVLCVILCCISTDCSCFFKIAYAMIIGGALGNLIDRIRYGVVIDFIDFHIWDWHFPTFNLADLSIFIGVIMILLHSYK